GDSWPVFGRLPAGGASGNAAEARVGPALGVLELHHVADAVRGVGRAAVPALMVREIDVTGLAQEPPRPASLECRDFLSLRGKAAGVVAAWNELRGTVLDGVDVAEGTLDGHPEDRHPNAWVEARNLFRKRVFER